MAMLFALTFTLALLADKRLKFVMLPINLLIFFNLLGSKSRAGFLGAVIAVLISLPFLGREVWVRKLAPGSASLCFCLMPFVMDAFTWKKRSAGDFLKLLSPGLKLK